MVISTELWWACPYSKTLSTSSVYLLNMTLRDAEQQGAEPLPIFIKAILIMLLLITVALIVGYVLGGSESE